MKENKRPNFIERLRSLSDGWILGMVLLIALVHGLIYVALIPPWQHYDEPRHFEVAWLTAHHEGIPGPEDYDADMSLAVIESMIESDFYASPKFYPDLESGDQIRITGYSQLDEPAFYYLLASLPMRFLDPQDVETQLYAGRMVSLVFYLLTVLAAWGTTRELTRPGSAFRWLVPLTVGLIPAFTDLMTALNNDAAAVAVMSLFLWGSVRLLKRGFSWLTALAVILLTGLAVFTKSTVLIAVPLLVFVLLLVIIPERWRWVIWPVAALALVGVALLGILSGDASGWARNTFQQSSTRLETTEAVLGEAAFQVVGAPENEDLYQVWLGQILPPETSRSLHGEVVTIGAWIWASEPVEIMAPRLQIYPGLQNESRRLVVDENPQFFAYHVELNRGTNRVWLFLSPFEEQVEQPVKVFMDGILLLRGEYPIPALPVYDDADGLTGEWDGIPFKNLLRNPSAEDSWIRLRSWVDRLGWRVFPEPFKVTPSVILYTLLDWQIGADYYWGSAANLFRTFWAKFGWGNVPLLGHKPYRPLAAAAALGIIGFVIYIFARRRTFPWDIAFIFLFVILIVCGFAMIRGPGLLFGRVAPFYPVARYVYPSIVPMVILLVTGWVALTRLPVRWMKASRPYLLIIFVLIFLALDIYAIVSILTYYS